MKPNYKLLNELVKFSDTHLGDFLPDLKAIASGVNESAGNLTAFRYGFKVTKPGHVSPTSSKFFKWQVADDILYGDGEGMCHSEE